MRALIVSDLHIDIDHNAWRDPPVLVDVDVAVIIGDVTNPMTSGLEWVARTYGAGERSIIYVPGNHDFYRGRDGSGEEHTFYEEQMERGIEMTERLGITLLHDRAVEICGVRWLGATGWGDFSMLPAGMTVNDAMSEAQKGWWDGSGRYRGLPHNDFREIRVGGGNSRHRLTPSTMLKMHRKSTSFVEMTLATPFDGDTVCISHMGPVESVEPGDFSYLYGWSDMQHLMHGPLAPKFWLHGHVHKSLDYAIGDTRVICNPRGYPGPGDTRENPDFDPLLTIEVGRDLTPGMRI